MQVDPKMPPGGGLAVPLKPLTARPGGIDGAPPSSPSGAAPVAAAPPGEGEFTFFDLLDVINPLQHIPVVSTLYRQLTGDTISDGARLAGDTLYGGPIGFISWVANSVTSAVTGMDIGQNVLAFFTGGGAEPEAPTQVAEAAPAATPSIAAFETAAGAEPLAQTLSPPATAGGTAELERFAAAERESARRWAAFARTPAAGPPPSGSLAPEGGWFTNSMLSALERYRQASDLQPASAAKPHAVNELH